jgi:hypothetical protein
MITRLSSPSTFKEEQDIPGDTLVGKPLQVPMERRVDEDL